MTADGTTEFRVVIEADGGSRGNPGPAGYGAVVVNASTGDVLAEQNGYLGIDTNNVAEYQGLIAGLTAARELGATSVSVRMDSKLVVEQMSGRWQVKHPSIRPLARRAQEIARTFASIDYRWIPREQNKLADRLANQAMDAGTGRSPKPARQLPADRPIEQALEASAEQLTLAGPTPQSAWLPPDAKPTRLVLVRHGVTAYSVAKRFAGRSDLNLTDDGRDQAERAARRVAQLGRVDAIVSSPLQRTRQTAQIIADHLGAIDSRDPTKRNVTVDLEDGLVETDFGDWDGYTFAEVSERWPDQLARWMADPSVAPPNGEAFETVTRRVRRARDRILADHPAQTVVTVSHVTPIKTLVRLALDAPASAVHRMFLSPASITVIDYFADGPCSVRSVNDTAHLND